MSEDGSWEGGKGSWKRGNKDATKNYYNNDDLWANLAKAKKEKEDKLQQENEDECTTAK